MAYRIQGPLLGQAGVCLPIIRALPDWFGLETAIQGYAREIDALPTWLSASDGQVVGFLSLKQHNPYSAEVYVMGVRPEAQGGGIGRALVQAAEAYARGQGVEYLQVKTLGPSNPDPGYAGTRRFYAAMGFRPLEEFTRIWDEHNPCLVLVKRV